ncbi:acyl-CoA-binding protein homolog [Daphnia pulicaria]|uniref:acyl-CoA-binding protein homolog n=1 Tax=Daphnia pulicaria TaxID=35523 RepID=UPI001EEAD52D|nr:acyl-CoA-binding protein homolog [Daphnia pulicaria]
MSLDEKFNKAAEAIRTMTIAPSDDEMKEIYALYKQSTVGDVNTARPGMMDLKGKAKWDSWEAKKGMSLDAAKEAYVSKTEELVTKYSASSA